MSSSTPIRISIIGAGPGGLTLARILLLQQQRQHPALNTHPSTRVEVTIYERDPSRSTRTMGGSLDLRVWTGLRAMKDANLIEEFKGSASRLSGDRRRIYDRKGVLRVDMDPPPAPAPAEGAGSREEEDLSGRPEIDRNDLRAILIDSLPPSTIKWNHRLTSITPSASPDADLPQYTLTFSSGHTALTNILIGADGASSVIRTLLNPAAKPTYSSLVAFDLTIPTSALSGPDAPYTHLVTKSSADRGDEDAEDRNALTFFAGGKLRRSIITQWNKGGRIRVNCNIWEEDEMWLDRFLAGGDQKDLKERIVGLYEGFDERVRDHIRAGEQEFILPRKVHATPLSQYLIPPLASQTWPGISLIGDAAHLMSPFAGMGVNLAMADAADLAGHLGRCLLALHSPEDAKAGLGDVLKVYAEGMFERARELGEISARNLEGYHREDAIEVMMKKFGGGDGAK